MGFPSVLLFCGYDQHLRESPDAHLTLAVTLEAEGCNPGLFDAQELASS